MQLSDFSALTFDCYGTLIDWESGIHTALAPWLSRHGVDLERDHGAPRRFVQPRPHLGLEDDALVPQPVVDREDDGERACFGSSGTRKVRAFIRPCRDGRLAFSSASVGVRPSCFARCLTAIG